MKKNFKLFASVLGYNFSFRRTWRIKPRQSGVRIPANVTGHSGERDRCA